MDTATGLLYVGNGQYYDPSTGRFLTRNAKPNQGNPYLPFDPTGAMLGPLAVLALLLGRKKKKKSKYDILLFVLVFAVMSGVTLTACNNPTDEDIQITAVVTQETTTITATIGPDTIVTSTPTPFGLPTIIAQATPCATAETPTPTLTVLQELSSIYGVVLMNGNLTWSVGQIEAAKTAIQDIANRFGSVGAFRAKFNISDASPVIIVMGTSSLLDPEIIAEDCRKITGGGCTSPHKIINFKSLLPQGGDYETRFGTARNNVVHEMGHVFSNEHGNIPELELDAHPEEFVKNRNSILKDNSSVQWQLNTSRTALETFADFFLAWTYNEWRQPLTDANGITKSGKAKTWMDARMQDW